MFLKGLGGGFLKTGSPRILFSLYILFFSSALSGYSQDAASIAAGSHVLGKNAGIRLSAVLSINDSSGIKERGIDISLDRTTGGSRILASVTRPAFLRNLKVLQLSEGGNTETWLKNSQGVRRLSSGTNSEGIFGSDFTLEDLSHFNPDEYTFALMKDSSGTTHHIEARPLGSSTYGRILIRIDKVDGLLSESIFYDRNNLEMKRFSADKIGTAKSGERYVRTAVIVRPDGRQSMLDITQYDTDVKFQKQFFAKGNL